MISVLLTGNKTVKKGIGLCILSILKNTKAPVHFYIFTMDLSSQKEKENGLPLTKEDFKPLVEYAKKINSENLFTLVDVTKDFNDDFSSSPNRDPKYSPYSLIRLFAPRYIKDDFLIYLDADTLTCSSLENFSKIDLNNKEMGVVLDFMGKFWMTYDYFNSGVLYINMKECAKTDLFQKCIDLLKKKKMYFADQSALYKLSKERVYLPSRFNEQRDIKPDTVVKHFCKGIKYLPYFQIYNVKQWEVEKVHSFLKINDFDDLYSEYEDIFKESL